MAQEPGRIPGSCARQFAPPGPLRIDWGLAYVHSRGADIDKSGDPANAAAYGRLKGHYRNATVIVLGQVRRPERLGGLPEGGTLPLLYPHTIGFPLHMAILTQPAFPLPIWPMLQVRIRLVQHAPLAREAEPAVTVRIAGHRILEKGA